jgi:hypothetical protein
VSQADPRNKASWFSDKTQVFRIESRGQVGNQEKVFTAIVERTVADAKRARKNKNYLASYKVHYWKML